MFDMPAMMIIVLLLGITPFTAADPTRRGATELDTIGNSTTVYQANLELLFAALRKNASSSPLLYAKGSVGVVPDKVYGMALCPGDINTSYCSTCIQEAFQRANRRKARDFVYSLCYIHFSDLNFLDYANPVEMDDLSVLNNYKLDDDFNTSIIKTMLQDTVKLAANTTRRYGTLRMDIKSAFPLFSMAQCNPELTPTDCSVCLKNNTDMATEKYTGAIGLQVLRTWCSLRYEAYQFFDGEPMHRDSVPPPQQAPTGGVTNRKPKSRIRKVLIVALVVPLLALFIICIIVPYGYIKRNRKGKGSHDKAAKMIVKEGETFVWEILQGKNSEFKVYDFSQVLEATCNFSEENKLGKGGFGPVYKGQFHDGSEIAVKRLASHSGQGFTEFKNEIRLIANLQHTNLVKLFGCCVQMEERILIYEYLPNKSLDFFIFDDVRKALLDWTKRLAIIDGIAQGLLYLHKHSRLRVIHRDLKASNVLLDHDMNPKISDFGLAKIFCTNHTEGGTKRIVGTYGYMAPEYASEGLFSVKSDVFSFGVLMLEIVSGKKTSNFHRYGDFINLLGHAWQLWKDGLCLQLVDEALVTECHKLEMMRCINVALLCVQENAADRPTMSHVVAMLSSEGMILPEPKHPAYYHIRVTNEEASTVVEPSCTNDVTISALHGR